MTNQLISLCVIHLMCYSIAACNGDGVVSQKYIALTSSGRSPVCAVDQPTSSVAARSKIQCASECTKKSWCLVHQLNDATKLCQLYNYLPTNYSGPTQHCITFRSNSPSPPGAVEAQSCSFPFTNNGNIYYTCAVDTSKAPWDIWCPLYPTGVRATCSPNAYGFVALNATVNVAITTTPVATNVPMKSVYGWLTVMSRVDRNFPTGLSLSYDFYKVGFGDINSNFMLGLDNLYTLTNPSVNGGYNYRLRIELLDTTGEWFSLEYTTFYIEGPSSNYVLRVSNTAAMGDLPDAINDVRYWRSPANGAQFATTSSLCVNQVGGFFWYTKPNKQCCFCNWLGPSLPNWYDQQALIFRMMIKQVN